MEGINDEKILYGFGVSEYCANLTGIAKNDLVD
jgi:hypothetical protein